VGKTRVSAESNPILELWGTNSEQPWKAALDKYWTFVRRDNRGLEEEFQHSQNIIIASLNSTEWYEYLRNKYFKWKYTARNRYVTTTNALARHDAEHGEGDLFNIRDALLRLDPIDIQSGLLTARRINGLGVPGASGLLSVMYPDHFGTVDQFVVKALRLVDGLQEQDEIRRMNPVNLSIKNGVSLIRIMRVKALELNRCFPTSYWTPRKVDMVLWASR
jgi:hypothetical protein